MTLRWETRRGSELRIEDDRGNEIFETRDDDIVDEGDVVVRPLRDTRYTLTVERGSRDDTCTEGVEVEGAEVSVITSRDQEPLTSLSLAQVPYTGFGARELLAGGFSTVLALWSASMAYTFVMRRGAGFGLRLG